MVIISDKSGCHLISGKGYKGTDHVHDNGKIEKNLIAAYGKSGPHCFQYDDFMVIRHKT